MTTYELDCKFDSRKSFYSKAIVKTSGEWGQNVALYSYDTLVARIGYYNADDLRQFVEYADCDDDCSEYVCELLPLWSCSATTLRHVKEFLAQFGFGVYRYKNDIIADCLASDYADAPMVLVRA